MKIVTITNRVTNRESTSFNQYLKDIYDISIMTPAEEIICAQKACLGDEDAREELVVRNLRFVVSVAKQYATAINPVQDLVNEGNIGLIIASQKFKPEMGWRFISYAVWWIQKLIHEHLSKHGRMVRLPANKLNSLSKLDKKIGQLEQKLGRSVDIQEVIEEFKNEIETGDFEDLEYLKGYSMDSLDREIGNHDHDSNTSLSDLMVDDTIFKPTDHLIIDVNIKDEISRIISSLKPRDKRIMTALYGLDGNSPMTLKELGDEIGVTREMIRQIKCKVLNILKNKLKGSSLITCY